MVKRLARALVWNRGERIPEHIGEQTVDIAASSGEIGSPWPGEHDTTTGDVTAVAKSAGKARPPGIAAHSASTKSDFAVSSGEAGPSRSRVNATISADVAKRIAPNTTVQSSVL